MSEMNIDEMMWREPNFQNQIDKIVQVVSNWLFSHSSQSLVYFNYLFAYS